MDGTDWTRETIDWDVEAFLPMKEVSAEVGICKSKIYDMIDEKRFPPPIKVDSRSFWLRSQVNAWKKAKVKENATLPWKEKWINVPHTKGAKRGLKPKKD